MDRISMQCSFSDWDLLCKLWNKVECAIRCWWNDYETSRYEEDKNMCVCFKKRWRVPMYHRETPWSPEEPKK